MPRLFYLNCFLLTVLLVSSLSARDSLLVWSDEFDYTGAPDSTKWSYEVGYLRNNEAQYYTEQRLENVRVENGALILEARLDSMELDGQIYPFTSGSVHTKNKAQWTYGKVEVRSRFDVALGTWPAHWLLSASDPYGYWPSSGEIDIMEHVGFAPAYTHANIHTEAYNWVDGTAMGTQTPISDPANTWHVHDVVWSQDSIWVSYDHEIYFRFGRHGGWQEWPFDHPFYLILNLAIGGAWGGQQGIDSTAFPLRMEVDYVRVYKMDLDEGNYSISAFSNPVEGGSVEITPNVSTAAPLTEISAFAQAAENFEFHQWRNGDTNNPASFLVDHDMVIVAEFLPLGEMLLIREFSEGLQGYWTFWGENSASTVSTSTGDACVKPAVAGETWSAQLDYPGLDIEAGETYLLEFTAYASGADKLIHGVLRQADDPYGMLSDLFPFTVGETAQSFSAELEAHTSYANGRLELDVGLDTQEVCFSSVSLRKASATGPVGIARANSASTLLKNHHRPRLIADPNQGVLFVQMPDGRAFSLSGQLLGR